jgi:hypothetical protein
VSFSELEADGMQSVPRKADHGHGLEGLDDDHGIEVDAVIELHEMLVDPLARRVREVAHLDLAAILVDDVVAFLDSAGCEMATDKLGDQTFRELGEWPRFDTGIRSASRSPKSSGTALSPSIAGPTGRWGREASFRAECLAKKPYGAKALALVTCEELASLDRVHYRERLEVG